MIVSKNLCQAFLIAALAATSLLPAISPAAPVARLLRVGSGVRQIVRGLRQIDIPRRWRQKNWIGDRGEGSCVHAALVHLWHWQGEHRLAEWWRQRFANGETAEGLALKLEASGVRFAETRTGDERFLEWAIRTRRGAAVVVQQGSHMVNLVGLDRRHAWLLDSNRPEQVERVARGAFLREWKESGGWGVTPVGAPPPPDPWLLR